MSMTRDELVKKINDTVDRLNKEDNPVKYVQGYINFLRTIHKSDAYNVIRDGIAPKKNKKVTACKLEDIEVYQEFQDLCIECKQSFDHDRKHATMYDVDCAVTMSYNMTLRMLRASMDLDKKRFTKLATAINKIEEHLGIDVTNFMEADENDTTKSDDVQGNEKTTN